MKKKVKKSFKDKKGNTFQVVDTIKSFKKTFFLLKNPKVPEITRVIREDRLKEEFK